MHRGIIFGWDFVSGHIIIPMIFYVLRQTAGRYSDIIPNCLKTRSDEEKLLDHNLGSTIRSGLHQ